MKKILILNGSHSELPLIKASKELGLFVITTGNDPKLIGHKYSDLYINEDFSQKERILDISIDHSIDYICSAANDFAVISASYVAEKLGLPGYDSFQTTLMLHQKDKFKKIASKLKLNTPKYLSYSLGEKNILKKHYVNLPLIVKPVDLTGGKGITKVSRIEELREAMDRAFSTSKAKRIIIEEYIDGSLHSFSTIIIGKVVAFYFSDNEFLPFDPFHVTASFSPSTNIDEIKNNLVHQVENLAEELDLKDGIFHIQYIYSKSKFYIIDITRRCSGDLYPLPVYYSSGLDLSRCIVELTMGGISINLSQFKQTGFYGRYCVISNKEGKFSNFLMNDKIKKYVIEFYYIVSKGEHIYINQKILVLILKFSSEVDISLLSKFEKYFEIKVD